jgi:hypothetical protein
MICILSSFNGKARNPAIKFFVCNDVCDLNHLVINVNHDCIHACKVAFTPYKAFDFVTDLHGILSRFASGNVLVDLVNQSDHGSHCLTDNRNVSFRMGDLVSFLCDQEGTHGEEVGEGERESGGVHAITVSRSSGDRKHGNVKL